MMIAHALKKKSVRTSLDLKLNHMLLCHFQDNVDLVAVDFLKEITSHFFPSRSKKNWTKWLQIRLLTLICLVHYSSH